MRQSLKTFPNNELLLVQLSTSLEKLDGTDDERLRYLRESIAVQEQILRYGEDSEVRGATLYNICFAYWKVGEFDKALEQARKLPNLYNTKLHLTALYETENDPVYLSKASQILDILFSGDKEDDFIKSIRERISL